MPGRVEDDEVDDSHESDLDPFDFAAFDWGELFRQSLAEDETTEAGLANERRGDEAEDEGCGMTTS